MFFLTNTVKNNSVVYQSSQQFTQEQLSTNDTKLGFFSLNPDELERLLFVNINNVKILERSPIETIIDERRETIFKSNKSKDKQSQKATISIVRSSSFSGVPSNPRVKVMGFTPKSEVSNSWQLIVKHRTGSLDIAVANLRQNNLLISSGILLLLAISMGMILISTRQAQNLAKQQMEFVAGVSHELRTPLAVICSAGENLADGVVNKPEQIKRYGSLIKGEGRRLADMVEQILEFAGWQSHKKTYQLQPTPIYSVIENAISACNLLISQTNAEIITDLDPNLPLVNADPSALQRAIQNLICNAIKYSGDTKWLKISAKLETKSSQVEINIIDKGIGISPRELPFIFEPFYRGQEVIDAQIHGNGLGLSLVRQAVTTCGGKITVRSIVDQGSTFTLYLPLADIKQVETKPSTEIARELYE
ncbi:MAG: periplasmic sensor signal transduction histidine kinase [bacterium]|nr:MAG: periplasmic sensor signal transduction histidine kinase [bacterium]